MSEPYGNVRLVCPIPPVADQVGEFFESLGLLRCAAWSMDGAACDYAAAAIGRRWGFEGEKTRSLEPTRALGRVARDYLADLAAYSLPGEVVIRETP